MTRYSRALEEAQGQRRLVSFGGGIALSAGSSFSQGSNAGKGGGSQGDAWEISSDESDGNGNGSGNDDDSDFVSTLQKPTRPGRVTSLTAAKPRQAGRGGDPHPQPHSHPTRGACQEPCRPNGSRQGTGTTDTAAARSDRSQGGASRRRSARSSLEAFERIISGEEFCLDSPPNKPAGKSLLPRHGGGCDAAAKGKEDASGNGIQGQGHGGDDDDDDDDDCCEIVFTRVSRPDITSRSSARPRPRPTKGAPETAAGKEAAGGGVGVGRSSRTSGSILSGLSESDGCSAGNESD